MKLLIPGFAVFAENVVEFTLEINAVAGSFVLGRNYSSAQI